MDGTLFRSRTSYFWWLQVLWDMRYVHSCAILIFSYITYHEHMPGKHMIYNTATTCSTSVHIVVTMARSYHDPLQTSGCFAGSACIGLKMTCGISIINERLESRCNAVKRWMWKVETWTVYIVTIYHVSVSLSLSLCRYLFACPYLAIYPSGLSMSGWFPPMPPKLLGSSSLMK